MMKKNKPMELNDHDFAKFVKTAMGDKDYPYGACFFYDFKSYRYQKEMAKANE